MSLIEPAADGQKLRVLLITCSDLGVDPHALLPAASESLYVLQNAGNIVLTGDDPDEKESACQVSAAQSLYGATDIVVCGHSPCGVIQWLLDFDRADLPAPLRSYYGSVAHSLARVQYHHRHLEGQLLCEALAAENVLSQLQNLLTIPTVTRGLARGELHLHGWFFQGGRVRSYDPVREEFVTDCSGLGQ